MVGQDRGCQGDGTNTDSSPLASTDTLYVDWAVLNSGDAATAARFYTELYVDGALRNSWYSDPPLNPNFYSFVEDYSIGSLAAGTHTIRIKTDSTGAVSESNESDNEYTKTITVGGGASPCAANSTTLCLSGGRFKVQVSFRTTTIPAGTGTAVPLTGDTGYSWFFSSTNVELVIKVLDGRALNNRFWVFFGALSDVEYTITVTDTQTGTVKTYFNPQGQVASTADTSAFDPSGATPGSPSAHVEIDHPNIGELVVTLGVGNPASPSCAIAAQNRSGAGLRNLVREVDLTPCAGALPPSTSNRWYLEVRDEVSGNVGQIRIFQIRTGGQTFSATDVPVAIPDLQTGRSYIPSSGSPPPPPPPSGQSSADRESAGRDADLSLVRPGRCISRRGRSEPSRFRRPCPADGSPRDHARSQRHRPARSNQPDRARGRKSSQLLHSPRG